MFYMKRFLALLLSVLLLTGCSAPASETEPAQSRTQTALAQISQLGSSPDDNYRVWYEIFVYSFCDSNGDGIGDLPGVTSRLDYLQELGVNGIWLMPIHPSKSYHKYDVSNYNAIDPAYGSLDDFRELLAECEKRDIHVILDLVVNHTGSDHHWFTAACDYLRALPDGKEPNCDECPYLDYYHFSREQKNGFNSVEGTDWYYESMFSPDMPDLNLANGLVRQEIDAIMAYWLDMGVAGFRLDAAKEFYSGSAEKNIEVLSWIQETASAYKEDVYLVAEVWDSFNTITDYYRSGLTSIFDYPFGNSDGKIITILRNAGNPAQVGTYATALEKADKAYSGSNPNYIDAPFLSNHDVGRIASFCGKDESKTKLAGAMNLLMSGSAFLYYGEEIGMVGIGNDPSKRAPMYWNAARDKGTTNPPPECELPESYPFGSLEDQKDDDNSIYNYYRQAIAIRKALPVISHGDTTAEAALNTGCVSAFRKTWGDQECIILMNIDASPAAVDLSGYDGWTLAAALSVSEEPITQDGTTLNLPPYGVAILIP